MRRAPTILRSIPLYARAPSSSMKPKDERRRPLLFAGPASLAHPSTKRYSIVTFAPSTKARFAWPRLIPRDGNVAGKDGVPEMGLGTKNGKLQRGIFFVVEDRQKQRVPLKSRSAIHCNDIERHDRFFELVSHARYRSRHTFELDPANGCFPDTVDADAVDRHKELILADQHRSQAVGRHCKYLVVGQHDAMKEILREGEYGSEVKRPSVGPLGRIDQFRAEAENIRPRRRGWRTHDGRSGAQLLMIFMPVIFVSVGFMAVT